MLLHHIAFASDRKIVFSLSVRKYLHNDLSSEARKSTVIISLCIDTHVPPATDTSSASCLN